MPFPSRQRCAALIFCCGALAPLATSAEGLGKLKVLSHLGDYFHAEIPVVGGQFPSGEKCVQLTSAPSDADADLPALKNATITLNAARTLLTITSHTHVNEPALRLSLALSCGSYLTRHYTVLLSPPADARLRAQPEVLAKAPSPATVAATATPPGPAALAATPAANPRHLREGESVSELSVRRYPGRPAKQKWFRRRMLELNPELLTADTLSTPPAAGVTLRYPIPPSPAPLPVAEKAPRGKKSEPAKYRLEISAPTERTDYRHLSPQILATEIGDRLGDVDKDILDMRRELDGLRAQYPDPPAAMRALLVEMDARLARVELNATRTRLAVLAQNASPAEAAATTPPPSPPSPPTPPTPVTPTLPTLPTPPVAVAPVVATPPANPAPATKPRKELVAADHGSGWLGLGALVLFGAGLGGFLVRRARRRETLKLEDLTVPTPEALQPTSRDSAKDSPHADTADAAAVARATAPEPSVEPGVGPGAEPSDEARPVTAAANDLELAFTEQISPVREALYLAEMFRSYGRMPLAIETLKEFIAANPAKSLLPSLCLMRIYRGTDEREAFEKLARHLAFAFNVEPVDWDTDVRDTLLARPTGSTLESVAAEILNFPHVFTRIKESWPSADCLDYLHGLLKDSRDGQRRGFSLVVIHEISALIEILECQLLPRASTSASPSLAKAAAGTSRR